MRIELVRWTDANALPPGASALIAEAVGEGHGWMAHLTDAWRQRPFVAEGEGLIVAMDGAHLLATAAITMDPYLADPTVGRLRYIYVRQTARGQGLAARLVSECLRIGAGTWQIIRLHTENEIAARLYIRHGFAASKADPRATHILACGSVPAGH